MNADARADAQFERYKALLLEWNAKLNLTAITDDGGIRAKHFADSLTAEGYIPQGARVIDVGAGAGFPGLPLKIRRPDLDMTLLDALAKRVTFLEAAIEALELTGVRAVHARAEEAGHSEAHRAAYDVAIARAVAELPALSEYCLPLVKTGGLFIAMKGPNPTEETEAAAPLISALGGAIEAAREATLPDGSARTLILIRKICDTPPRYPRRPSRVGRAV